MDIILNCQGDTNKKTAVEVKLHNSFLFEDGVAYWMMHLADVQLL